MLPKISVIIPTYNGERYIKATIDSVLFQTHSNLELIIIDDGSIDGTKNIIEGYQDNRIRYFYQKNRGVAAARNAGIIASEGEFISFIDHDDYFLPTYLEKCLDTMYKKSYDVVIPRFYYKLVESISSSNNLLLCQREELPSKPNELFLRLLQNFVGCMKMVVKKNSLEKVGLLDERFLYHDDLDLWLRFARADLRTGVTDSQEPLWVYRILPSSLFHSMNNKAPGLLDHYKLFKKHMSYAFAINKDIRQVYETKLREIGVALFKCKNTKFIAMLILLESQFCSPNLKEIFQPFLKKLKII